MKVLNVSCNNCGAPLEVPQKTKFLTCKFCESRLEIQKSGNAYFTNVLEAVSQVQDDVQTIKLQNELERVDREWTMERERFMTTDQHGRRHVPTVAGGVAMVAIGVLGCVFVFAAARDAAKLVGLLFLAVAGLFGYSLLNRAKQYGESRRRYEARRRALARELRGR